MLLLAFFVGFIAIALAIRQSENVRNFFKLNVLRVVVAGVFGFFYPKYLLSPDHLMARARHITGFRDFELPKEKKFEGAGFGPEWLEGLQKMCDSFNAEGGKADSFGRFMFGLYLVRFLIVRLKFVDALKNNPEILEEPVVPPIIIAGLPRSGTTKLHRLLANNPELTAFEQWELGNPFFQLKSREAIYRVQKIVLGAFKFFMVDSDNQHVVQGHLPDEDHFILGMSFADCGIYDHFADIPSHTKWAHEKPRKYTLETMRTFLKFDAWRKRTGARPELWPQTDTPPRHVLKNPFYGHCLPLTREVFPGCKILFPVREPVSWIASCCTLRASTRDFAQPRSATLHPDYMAELGEFTVKAVTLELTGISDMWKNNRKQGVWLQFSDFVKADRRAKVFPGMYKELGLKWDETEAKRVEDDMNGPRHGGGHRLGIEAFGLTKERIQEVFEEANVAPEFLPSHFEKSKRDAAAQTA